MINKKKSDREYKKKCVQEWTLYFIERYGEYPKCEICGKTLTWKTDAPNKVHFDHRYNNEVSIKNVPFQWVANHICSEKNRKIWLSCDFGILCTNCNLRLPTKDRLKFLCNIFKYILGDNLEVKIGRNY